MPWIVAFVLTLLVEVPLWVLMIDRGALVWRLCFAVAVNTLTHPLLWAVASGQGWGVIVLLECMVAAVEGALMAGVWRLGWLRSVLTALIVNASSVLVGLMLALFHAL